MKRTFMLFCHPEASGPKDPVRSIGSTGSFALLRMTCFLCLISHVAFAASLSELNMKGFQDRVAPTVKASENPFIRQNVSPDEMMVEDLHLSGIIYSPGSAYALISGYSVEEGEQIAGFKVKLIERDHVVLKQLDQVKILKLE